MLELIETWLKSQGANGELAYYFARGISFVFVLLLSLVANTVAKRVVLSALSSIIARTRTSWDDTLLKRKVLNRLVHLAPALVIYVLTPAALSGLEHVISGVTSALVIYMIVVTTLAFDAFMNGVVDIYQTYDISRQIPIKGFIQVVKLIVFFLAGIFVISTLLDKTPLFLLSGLGALTAVLMLIFKDAILGLVAGIQLTANKMVAHGDWVEMPRYGADGDVLEVSLTTVKVQNWDKTITTIPTYALISESFKNWRGMQQSDGRRIKRSINIDMNTVKFCTEEMLQRFAKIQYITEYIERKKKELAEFNQMVQVDNSSLVNGRRMTNLGTFRAYVNAYLRNHPMVNQKMTLLVRQLQPTGEGLPIEIYLFSKDKAWVNYEAIQSDIFDHLLAVVSEFDLRLFQRPTGLDLHAFSNTLNASTVRGQRAGKE
ncbi:MAG: mechanosensitive ion channel family protein [bacterium]